MSISDVRRDIDSDEEKLAYKLQLENIIEYFPGVKPRSVMVLRENGPDVYPDDKVMKLQMGLFEGDQERLTMAIIHGLIHYATNDPAHGDKFNQLVEQLGMTDVTTIECYFTARQNLTAVLNETGPETPLYTIKELMSSCLKDCMGFMEPNCKAKDKVVEMDRLWHLWDTAQRKQQSREDARRVLVTSRAVASPELEPSTPPAQTRLRAATTKPRCPNCNSRMIYIRMSIDQFVCRSCGNQWPSL